MWLGILAGVLFKKCANEALAQQLFVRIWGGKWLRLQMHLSGSSPQQALTAQLVKTVLSSMDLPLLSALKFKKSAMSIHQHVCEGFAAATKTSS